MAVPGRRCVHPLSPPRGAVRARSAEPPAALSGYQQGPRAFHDAKIMHECRERLRRRFDVLRSRSACACATTLPYRPREIWTNKAVLRAAHIKAAFLKMIGPQDLNAGFRQRIQDLSLLPLSLTLVRQASCV